MHKSWGNAIDFDEAAERMGVDVMRWLFAKARPEENIMFGWHAADEARRELLVLWNVYAFFVTYARPGRLDSRGDGARRGGGPDVGDRHASSIAGSARAPRRRRHVVGDRLADTDARRRDARDLDLHRRPVDLVPAPVAEAVLARTTTPPTARPRSRRSTARSLALAPDRGADPAVPDRHDVRQPRGRSRRRRRTRVHLTRWPADELAADPRRGASRRRWRPPGGRRAGPDAARHGRDPDAPAARPAVARPAGRRAAEREALIALIRDEVNVRAVELIGDESELVERRVKPLLPKIGKKLGAAIPAIMAAARENAVEYRAGRLRDARRRHPRRRTRSRSSRRRDRARPSPTTRASSSSSTPS